MSRWVEQVQREGITREDVEEWVWEEQEAQAELSTGQNNVTANELTSATGLLLQQQSKSMGYFSAEWLDGCFQAKYVQLNNILTSCTWNMKVAMMQELIWCHYVHCMGLNEIGCNWSLHKPLDSLSSFMPDLSREVCTYAAYNTHKQIS